MTLYARAMEGIGKSAHSPRGGGRQGDYGLMGYLGRSSHSPRGGGRKGDYGLGKSAHSPRGRGRKGDYGMQGWDFWQEKLGSLFDAGSQVLIERTRPDGSSATMQPPQVVYVQPAAAPAGAWSFKSILPLAVVGGLLFLLFKFIK